MYPLYLFPFFPSILSFDTFVSNSKFSKLSARNLLSFLFFFDRKNRKTLAKTLITKFIYIISVSFNFILE